MKFQKYTMFRTKVILKKTGGGHFCPPPPPGLYRVKPLSQTQPQKKNMKNVT